VNGPGDIPPHYLRHNQTTRLPRRHVVLDTEAVETSTGSGRTQTFRLACAAFDHQTKAGRGWRPTERATFTTAEALWAWIDGRARDGQRLVVVAHNMAYDLRISDAFTILPSRGWRLDMVRLDGGAAWCSWRQGKRSMVCVDSVSWFGVGLEQVAQAMGTGKRALPSQAAGLDEWEQRCATDVELLRAAWRRVLDWIEAADLGNWKPTGAGQGWAMFRHRHLTHRILHHACAPIAAVEREAAYAGRCEAWRWGKLPAGTWTEWDFQAAYARVAEECDVPVHLAGHLGPRGAQRALGGLDGATALVQATVATETPTVPLRANGGILWPVGRFEGWWWAEELAMAAAAGATVDCHQGWRYATAPALRSWAGWVLDTLAAPSCEVDPVCRLVVKGWSRTTVGRFGAQWAGWDDIGESHGGDVRLMHVGSGDPFAVTRWMMVGGRTYAEGDRYDAPDGAPQIMSWIMAACRIRLWAAMGAAGLGNVAYVDTDGLLVNDTGSEALEAAGLPGLRPKARWRSGEVLGPRQLVLGGKLRAAGIPLAAVRVGPRTWEAEIWRSLPASIREGEVDRVVITDRRFVLRGTDRRRAHGPGGVTAAVRVG
jgi:hypothetical protein